MPMPNKTDTVHMKPRIISSLFVSISLSNAFALSPGDLAFTSINADEDGWAMVALAPIPANTTIYFTDNEWDGSAFNTGESYTQWVSGGSIIPAGTVIRFSSVDTVTLASSVGSLTRASVSGSINWGLSSGEESIYAYQASSASAVPTVFVAAICNTSFGTATAGVLTNTGLSIGSGAIQTAYSSGSDFAEYNGPRSGQATFAAYLPSVSNIANWTVDTSNGVYGTTVPNTSMFSIVTGPTSVDLSTYVRVGRYDLPEPTRTTPPADSLLAQEASGVTYNWDADTLFIVGDGGTSVTEVTKTGTLVSSMTLPPGGSPQGTEFFDTEGITYIGGGEFVMTEERDRRAVKFTYVAGGTLTRAAAKTVQLGTSVGNIGLEGLSYDPQTSGFIFVKEMTPEGIFQTTIDFVGGTASNGSPTTVNSLNLFDPALADLEDMSDVFAFSNLPSMAGQTQEGNLLILSQESGMIRNIDRSGNTLSTLTLVSDPGNPLSIQNQTHEGVTMDREGNIYVVSENGGGDADHPQLWVFAPATTTNLAPTALALSNSSSSIPENTSTSSPIKMTTIVVTDVDGVGVNDLSVSGADAADFEIIGSGLYLKTGSVLNFSTKSSYSVNVDVDDVTVGSTPDASANFVLNITEAPVGSGPIRITEVAPWSSGNSAVAADWFELTNTSGSAVDISGWKMTDSAATFGSAGPITGISSIAAGESVIFVDQSKTAEFITNWFGSTPPSGFQIGTYGGPGLSTGGDGVTIFDAGGNLQASVSFGASPGAAPYSTFDNTDGLDNTTISQLSALGANGAFTAAASTDEIGSPGTAVVSSTPIINITATDADAAEAASDPGTFRVTRTGSTLSALTVNYTVATGTGEATSADYNENLSGAVEIPAGASFVDVTVTPVDDALQEGVETVTLTVFDTGSYDVGLNGTATVSILDNDTPNQAPTAVVLTNTVTTITDATSTASPVLVADISITDDGQGANDLSLSGADAASFEITGSSLYLKAGTALNGVTKPTYEVTVDVDDASVGINPDASVNFTLNVTQAVAPGTIIISEISPWSSTLANSPLGADWFEITNTGSQTVDITGWKMDDNSHVLSAAVPLGGITRIAPGEAVIFIETTDLPTIKAAFLTLWFGSAPPAGLQIGAYSGPGLGSGGDEVNLFDAAGNRIAGVGFGVSPALPGPFATFDNHAGLNSVTDPVPTVSTLSVIRTNGAITAANDSKEIGSPGIGNVGRLIVSEVSPWSSTLANSALGADWFEVANIGTEAVDMTGWKMDDNSHVLSAAVPLSGVTSIAPGEAVVFIETTDLPTTKAAFLNLWFGSNPPAGLQIGAYSGPGLGSGGDEVTLFNAAGNRVSGIGFGASPAAPGPFATFDNNASLNGVTDPVPTVSTLSVAGTNGAFLAVSDTNEIGSPGAISNYTLQVLHFYGESGLLGVETAPIMGAMIDKFKTEYANSVVVAEGDTIIPGPWLVGGADPSLSSVPGIGSTALGRPDIAIFNAFGTTASALGNHEFDLGSSVFQGAIAGSGAWVGAQFPFITSNLDFSGDSFLKGLADTTLGGTASTAGLETTSIKAKFAPYAIKTVNGEKIGFVGATTYDLLTKTSPSGTVPKSTGAVTEAAKLAEVAAYVQTTIDALATAGVNKIIMVDQLDTLERNKQLAPLIHGVDIMVAGGGHERMGDATDTAAAFNGHDATFVSDTYPIVTAGSDGQPTLIVTTDTEFSYLGRTVLDFDANGVLILPNLDTAINGAYASTEASLQAAYATANSAATIIAGSTIGSQVKAIVDGINAIVIAKDSNVFGYTDVYLEGDRVYGRAQEVNLGDVTADANAIKAKAALGLGANTAVFSLKNGGGIRASIGSIDEDTFEKTAPAANPATGKPAGAISQLDIENALRFDNKLMVFDTTPQGLLNILNYAAGLSAGNGGFPQVGNVRYSYDPSQPAGQKVRSIVLTDENGVIVNRVVENGALLPGAQTVIPVVALNFTANGGDGYPTKANGSNFRYLLTNGTLSSAVSPALDFTLAATFNTVGITGNDLLGEQKAFQDYLASNFATAGSAFNIADTPASLDLRIENLSLRADAVLVGPATFEAWLSSNGYTSAGIDTDSDSDGLTDRVEYFFNLDPNSVASSGNLPAVVINSASRELHFKRLTSLFGVTGTLQMSDDLLGTWPEAVLGVDYEIISETANGDETDVSYHLLGTDPKKFYRFKVN